MSRQSGFTLIEVLIATTILAFLAVFTSQAIQRAVMSKAKVTKDIDRVGQVRDALRVIERDINLAFNYKDINIALYNAVGKGQQNQPGQPNTPPPGSPPGAPPQTPTAPPAVPQQPGQPGQAFQPKEQKIMTHFLGDTNSIHFTTLNNVRTVTDSPISDQAEVGYYIDDCRNRIDKKQRSKCLWRRSASVIDDKVEEGGEAIVLLENVREFELRYLGPESETEWKTQWFTSERGDDVTKNKFPYAVEVTVDVLNENIENSKPTRMTMVAQLRFPNNEPLVEEDNQNGQQNPNAPGAPQSPNPNPNPPGDDN